MNRDRAPHRRFLFIFLLLILFTGYVLVHYALTMFNNESPQGKSSQIQRRHFAETRFRERGAILDRNGRFLAISTRFADVSVWKPSINDYSEDKQDEKYKKSLDFLSNEVALLLDMTPLEIQNRINASESDFLYLKKQVDDAAARRLAAVIEEKKINGVMIQFIVGRQYPEKSIASQIVGFVGDSGRGLEGIEFAFNDILDGVDNENANNAVIEIKRGSQIYLTIDVFVQYILEQIAQRTMNDTGAEAVMLLAMDPRTGDILGSASLPNYDLNNFRASNSASRMNRPAIWAYEPGSVFKVFSMSALMDSQAISDASVFRCDGVYKNAHGDEINCLGSHGNVTAREVILYSCNAGAAYASDKISNSAFYHLLIDYGFGSRTRAGSPGETAGYLVSSDRWNPRSKPTLAIGQEIAVSAFQILQAATAVANDGVLVPPRIISRIVSADGRTSTEWKAEDEARRVLKAETARAMRSYMTDTATAVGTGWRAAVEDMSLAVKTGTAQIIDPVTKRYSETDFIASCIALLPAEAPTLVLYLAIIKPKGETYGGRIAAPAIREAAESLIDYLGIPRGRNPQMYHPPSVSVPAGRLPVTEGYLPDYSGLAKRVLLPLLLRDDINVEIRGDGWVKRQTPQPGTPIERGMSVILELE